MPAIGEERSDPVPRGNMASTRRWWGWFGLGLALAGMLTVLGSYVAWWWPTSPVSAFRPSALETVALVLGTPPALWSAVAAVKAPQHARAANGIRAAAATCGVILGAAAVHHWAQPGAFAPERGEALAVVFWAGLTAAAAAGYLGMAIAFRPVRKGIAGVLGGSATAVALSVATSVFTTTFMTTPTVDPLATERDGAISDERESPAAVPATVSGVSWRWEDPDGSLVSSVVTAGGAVMIQVMDGLVALDSATGRERWRYRRPGSYASRLTPSSDGRIVMVDFRKEIAPAGRDRQTVLLDAHTGEVVARHMNAWAGADDSQLHSAGVITSQPAARRYSLSPGSLTGWHPKTSRPAWRYSPPKGCAGGFADGYGLTAMPGALGRDVFAQLIICAPWVEENPRQEKASTFTWAVVGLDPATGAELWRQARKVSARPDSVRLHRSADRGAFSVTWGEDNGMVLEQATGKVLSQRRISGLFSGERFLHAVPGPQREHERAYGWDPFGAGERKRASFSLAGLVRTDEGDQRTERLPLKDALVVAYPHRAEDGVTVTALVTAWGTADTVRMTITLPHALRHTTGDIPRFGLLPAPGAVIVAQPQSRVIVGLA